MRGARSRWGSELVLLSSLAATGCVTYRAQVARDIQRGEVTVHVDEVRGRPSAGGSGWLDVRMREVPPGVRLLGASVSGFEQSFCEGVHADKLRRDGGGNADAPLVPGERLSLGFSAAALYALSMPAPRLDLSLVTARGTRRCVSLPLAPPGKPLHFDPQQRFTVGLDLSIEGFTSDLGPVSQVVTFPVQIGMWVDHFHLEAGAGIAGAGCPDRHCRRPSESQRINYANAVPMYAGVRWIGYEHGELSLGAGLRYRAIRLAADTYEGHQVLWMHGPVLSPYIGAGLPFRRLGQNEVGGAREALIAFEIPVGYAFAENGDKAVSIGANISALFTVF